MGTARNPAKNTAITAKIALISLFFLITLTPSADLCLLCKLTRKQGEDIVLNNIDKDSDFQIHFTQEEIDKLKERKDLAIDWDKAIIEPVSEED